MNYSIKLEVSKVSSRSRRDDSDKVRELSRLINQNV